MNISKYIGIPFLSHGRSFEACDCYGLCRLFYEHEFGVKLPLLDSYEDTMDLKSISTIIGREKSEWKRVNDPRQGDVVVIRIAGVDTHVGIYLSRNRMLHAFKNINSCIENLSNPAWKSRISGYYRYE